MTHDAADEFVGGSASPPLSRDQDVAADDGASAAVLRQLVAVARAFKRLSLREDAVRILGC